MKKFLFDLKLAQQITTFNGRGCFNILIMANLNHITLQKGLSVVHGDLLNMSYHEEMNGL